MPNWTPDDVQKHMVRLSPDAPAILVKARPARPWGQYRSQTELRYSWELDLMQKLGAIDAWQYEAVTLRLAKGVSYTPDFVTWVNGFPAFIEVKGRKGESFWSRPLSKVKIRLAARMFPHWRFYITWPAANSVQWERLHVEKA